MMFLNLCCCFFRLFVVVFWLANLSFLCILKSVLDKFRYKKFLIDKSYFKPFPITLDALYREDIFTVM